MNSVWLAPSMMCLPAWHSDQKAVQTLQECNVALLHADIMDGEFVPNLMLGTDNVKDLRTISRVPIDLHLMIQRPEDKLSWFDIQPGDYVSIHVESTRHLQRALAQIRTFGAHAAVALNPATPLYMVEDVLPDVDMVLLMTVNPGFAGQKLWPQAIKKIARLRQMLDENGYTATRLEVDGNVSFEHIPKMRGAGADTFVCGTSSIFHKSGTIQENITRMNQLMQNADNM